MKGNCGCASGSCNCGSTCTCDGCPVCHTFLSTMNIILTTCRVNKPANCEARMRRECDKVSEVVSYYTHISALILCRWFRTNLIYLILEDMRSLGEGGR
jgi:hypothetical protein